MARNFGRVVYRKGSWQLDFGRLAAPRYLFTARGAKLESRQMAESVLEAIRVAIARGVDPQAAVDEFAPPTTERNGVAHWLDAFVERQAERELSPNTLRAIQLHVRLDLTWWRGRSLAEINAESIDAWVRWLQKHRKIAPKSVRNALGVFHAFLRWLRRMERLDRIPEFPAVSVPDHSPTIISQRTQALILDAIPHERRGIFLALCHGVRPGEARALELRDVQEREGVPGLVIRRAAKDRTSSGPIGTTKTGEAAWIPISDELVEWIAWRLEQRGVPWTSTVLFVNPKAHHAGERNRAARWAHDGLRTTWLRACSEVGIRVGLYEGTKHSSATAWRSGGMSLEHVRRMLRHRDARSTERYGKLTDAAVVEAFRRRPKR